ncbi:MAG: chromosomal replication initiator protein DnaA [Candidatus Omnitrophica bacterium]|nr:chromosomal replication initiator protein DnaA [Candidatus Omnitrophota bacterium]
MSKPGDELLKIWERASAALKERLGESVFSAWILPLKPRASGKDALSLLAPDAFFKNWIEENYQELIREAIRAKSGGEVKVEFGVSAKERGEEKHAAPAPEPAAQTQSGGFLNLNDRYTFENFVVGPSNRHAHAYAQAVADAPGKAYNPLFIWGGVGLGKTHLLQAICHQIKLKAKANIRICYVPSDRFTNELIDAIQHKTTPAFRQKYRSADALVVDDVHFIAGKDSSQEEFFNTFNALYDSHKQIILSSDRPPKEIKDLEERLISRFGWGLTVDIQPPDFETRVAILKKKIEREPVNVDDDAIFFIAQLIKTNIRELEGALIRTIAYSLLEEKPITLDLTKEVLKDLLKEPKKLITVDFIQRCVAEEFGITLSELKTRRRNRQIVLPRQIAMYLSRELTDLSLPEIGNYFGGKDHTTVLHSYNKIKEVFNQDPVLKERVERVIQIIKQ